MYVGIFSVLLIVSALVACALMLYALGRSDVPGSAPFVLMLAGEFIWATGYLRELGAASLEAKLAWDNLQFIGMQLIGVGAVRFALTYTRKERLLPRLRSLLWVEPALSTLAVWTDHRHGFVRSNVQLDGSTGYAHLVYGYGPWFWVSSLYNLALVLAAIVLLGAFAAGQGRAYRRQLMTMLVGLGLPIVGAFVTLAGLVPVAGLRNLDTSPLTFAAANAITAWGLFRRRLLEVVPIAREKLIDHLTDAVLVADAGRMLVDYNPRARELFEPGASPPVGVPLAQLWPALDGLIHPDLPADHPVELQHHGPEGRRQLAGTISPMRTARGRLTGWLVVLRDVTAERRAEELLHEHAFFIRRINQATPDIIYVYDLEERRVIYSNRASISIIGYGPELLQSLGSEMITTVIHADDLPLIAAHRVKLYGAKDDEVLSVEYRVQRADGRIRWLLGRDMVFARAADGRPRQILGVAQDVTASREAAAALVQAKETAEAADRAKSAFLATMSHEIRTPLNAVIGMADLLLLSDLPERPRGYAATIRTGGQTLLAIINNILDLSKIGAGKLELEQRPFNLRFCLEDAASLFTHTAALKGITLCCALDESLPQTIIGDETRLRQVVINLLANAVKFTEHGEVTLVAGAHARTGATVEVAITVQDTGIGIPQHVQETIFRPFTQADGSMTRRYGGTGLGLAISRELVELMGGRLSLVSTSGVGSAFTVHVSLHAIPGEGLLPSSRLPSAEQIAGEHLLDEPGGPERNRATPLRVLVVEDNVTNQRITALLLSALGHDVKVASDGREGLEAIRRCTFDVVLMDIQMPGMDGVEATVRIRALGGGVTQPWIIACTASALIGDRERYLAAGMDDYISKPVQLATLRATLARVHDRV